MLALLGKRWKDRPFDEGFCKGAHLTNKKRKSGGILWHAMLC